MKTLLEQVINELRISKVSTGAKLPKKGDTVYSYQANPTSEGFRIYDCKVLDIHPYEYDAKVKELLDMFGKTAPEGDAYEIEISIPEYKSKYSINFHCNNKLLKEGVINYESGSMLLTHKMDFKSADEFYDYLDYLNKTYGAR